MNKSVVRNKMKRSGVRPSTNCFPYDPEDLDEAKLVIETEAEKQIKLLLEKQLSTKVSLKECLEQKQKFVNSSTFTPLTELVQGTCSLEKYKAIESKEDKHQELQRCGLDKDEIALYLSRSEHNSVCSRKRSYAIEPSVANKKWEEIENKIALHQKQLQAPSMFSGMKILSRHALDIEKTLYVGCDKKEQLKNLVSQQNDIQLPESDPYSHIKQLSLKLVQNVQRMPKKRRAADQIESFDEEDEIEDSSDFVFDPSIHHVIVPLEEQEVLSNRLSVDDIKKHPKFKDYEPGVPNKVLFLKNLNPKVTIRELQSLFGRFVKDDDGCINYRILSGRMKGQAFITFPDVESAACAIQFVNGYVLRGRPIIVQYGKKC